MCEEGVIIIIITARKYISNFFILFSFFFFFLFSSGSESGSRFVCHSSLFFIMGQVRGLSLQVCAQATDIGAEFLKGLNANLLVLQMVPVYHCFDEEAIFEQVYIGYWH